MRMRVRMRFEDENEDEDDHEDEDEDEDEGEEEDGDEDDNEDEDKDADGDEDEDFGFRTFPRCSNPAPKGSMAPPCSRPATPPWASQGFTRHLLVSDRLGAPLKESTAGTWTCNTESLVASMERLRSLYWSAPSRGEQSCELGVPS